MKHTLGVFWRLMAQCDFHGGTNFLNRHLLDSAFVKSEQESLIDDIKENLQPTE